MHGGGVVYAGHAQARIHYVGKSQSCGCHAQARMSKEKFIESNRRTPDLAPLTDDFFSELYDEILVNEIKMEGAEDPVATAAASAATVSPRSSTPKGTPKGGQRKRRGSLSDMFAPGADGKALSVADQKQSFKELGQKMFDVQQRGIKGCPKKVQLGVNQVVRTLIRNLETMHDSD